MLRKVSSPPDPDPPAATRKDLPRRHSSNHVAELVLASVGAHDHETFVGVERPPERDDFSGAVGLRRAGRQDVRLNHGHLDVSVAKPVDGLDAAFGLQRLQPHVLAHCLGVDFGNHDRAILLVELAARDLHFDRVGLLLGCATVRQRIGPDGGRSEKEGRDE
jgi:hypothetical protein